MAAGRPSRGPAAQDPDPARTARDLQRNAGELATSALGELNRRLGWYQSMPAELRSWIGVILQSAITSFASWYAAPTRSKAVSAQVFGAAPSELTHAISLEQVVQIASVGLDAVEHSVPDVVEPAVAPQVREALLRYSREIAFAAATVYARAAEERGAWDARLEALVVDAVLRNDTQQAVRSQAATLRWPRPGPLAVVVGTVSDASNAESIVERVRAAARQADHSALVGVHGERMVVLLDNADDPLRAAQSVIDLFGTDPVVVGPRASSLTDVGTAAQAALAAVHAVSAWPEAPRPVTPIDLLPERVLAGEEAARATLLSTVFAPLTADRRTLLDTVEAYLTTGASIEGAARRLLVHPNTVRYRLRRVHELTGWSATDPRGQFVLRIALTVGRLSDPPDPEAPPSFVGFLQEQAQ
jgi:hypothetical protein